MNRLLHDSLPQIRRTPWEMAAPNSWERLPLPQRATIAQMAAWTTVSRVLLNLDETITKE